MNAETNRLCPKCGAAVPDAAPQGLCPKCLLAAVSVPTEPKPSLREPPPSLEAVAAAFPQLEVLELVGQGGMGFVFKARQPRLNRFVALKILPQSLAGDPAFAERFTREGQVLAKLSHPNIVAVHDFGQANGFFYLVMEFVDGVNLRQAMRAGRFTPAQALAVVPGICEALQFAHNEGVLHRDIKPENILLDSKGRVKIADFGIAKLVVEPRAEAPLTGSGGALGTPHYMAPEQIERPGEVDHRADIYSLGVVFYEMLTGELPLGRFAPPSEKSAADPRLDDVVFRTLEKEPARRTQSASEVKTQVETIATTPAAAPPQPSAAAGSESRSISWPSRVALGLLLAGPLGTLFLMTVSHRHEMALLFGITALVLAFVFGVLGWRERLGKGVAITIMALVVGLGAVVLVLTGGYLLLGRRAAMEARRQQAIAREQELRARAEISERLAPAARTVTGLATKTIQLRGATNEIRGEANPIRTVSVGTEALLRPGESIVGLLRNPDLSIDERQTQFFVHRRGDRVSTTTLFTWFIPESFSVAQMEEAVVQLRQNHMDRPISLTNGRPLLMFAVTNSAGGVLHGYLNFKHTVPGPDSPIATVRPRPVVSQNLSLFYSAYVPPGHSLEATMGGSEPRAGEAQSLVALPNDRQASWHPPGSFTPAEVDEAAVQLRRLANRGSFTVHLGQPFRAFSITNGAGEIFEGFFELFGPQSVISQVDRGGKALTELPTPEAMRDLGVRISKGDAAALSELRDIATDLYRDINYQQEQGRVLTNLALMTAAFRELGKQAGQGNQEALAALQGALSTRHLKSHVPRALGIAAAAGNDEALQMLLQHRQWNMLLSSVVFALGPVADKNNEQAVDFLIDVLQDPKSRALWYGASQGLQAAAGMGNARAKAALEEYERTKKSSPLSAPGTVRTE